MKAIQFEWDKNKAKINLAKHKISFEEAQSVFDDDNARLIFDPDHSEDEERFILLGLSFSLKVLVVCIATEMKKILFVLSQLEKQQKQKKKTTRNCYEKRI